MSIKDNFPTVRPQLLIDIANTEVLDPRVVTSRASVATYYDKFGVLQTASANEPRIGYNPSTGAVEGLIREAQATNLVTYSEDFGNAVWAKQNVTITVNTIVAPDGTLTGDIITSTGVNSYANRNISVANSTLSVYVKQGFGTFFTLFTDGASSNDGVKYDLSTGVVVTLGSNNVSASITSVGNGWYRLVVTRGATAGTGIYIGFLESGAEINDYHYIWGASLEANSYPTSYIKTEASQVTRAADTFLLTNSSTYDTDAFTAISQPFGVTSVSSGTVTLNGDVPIERLYVYPNNIAQDEINSVVENDGWWSWRIVGATFALPNFTTDGSIEVDWGDGTVETLTTAVHTFTNASPHTVKFRQMTGTYFRPYMNNNATYKTMIVAVGSAPSNMIVDCNNGFFGCGNLKSFDATLIGRTAFSNSWQSCTSLTSFPLIDTSAGTIFDGTWYNCSSLTSFPLIDTSSGTNFSQTWQLCSGLTSFPLIDTSSSTAFNQTWRNCSSLTSFPVLDMSSGTNFSTTFRDCTGLTSFPLINMNLGTNFTTCWYGCTSMTDFPANFFDSWTGTPLSNCFYLTWDNCFALTTTSVENILVSIDTSGQSPTGGTEITIDYNVATGALTAPTTSAITSLKGKNWTIRINGVLQ